MSETFWWNDIELTYWDNPYNYTRQNERAVELPIAHAWMRDQIGDGLEVGCVTPHYWEHDHTVVDLYEEHPASTKMDLFDVTRRYDWVLAISTVEHVNWDFPPRDDWGAIKAVQFLSEVSRGPMLITVPLGCNPELDKAIKQNRLGVTQDCTFLRTGGNQWVQSTREAEFTPYGKEGTIWANAVWVGVWE